MELLNSQRNILSLQKCFNNAITGICCTKILGEGLDHGLLKQAIQEVVDRQSAFSFRFEENGGQWTQSITEDNVFDIEDIDFHDRQAFDAYVKDLSHRRMDMKGNLYSFAICEIEGKTGIVLCMHHVISDAASVAIVLNDIETAYGKIAKGEERDTEVFRYEEHISSNNRYLCSKAHEKDAEFWNKMFGEKPERSFFKHGQVEAKNAEAERFTVRFPKPLAASALEDSLSLSIQMETVMALYMHKLNQDNETISIGMLSMNRKTHRDKKTVGMFVETLPMLIRVGKEKTLGNLADEIKALNLSCLRHQAYPLDEIRRIIEEKHEDKHLPYDVLTSCQADVMDAQDIVWHHNGYSEVPLQFHLIKRHEDLELYIDYQTEVFNKKEVEQMAKRLLLLWQTLLGKKDMMIKDVCVLPEQEHEMLIREFNDTYASYVAKPAHVMFRDQCNRYPGNVALIFEGKHFTYTMLDHMSDVLANDLRKRGVARNQLVPIVSTRDWRYVVGILAIMKAGGAFMPMSPEFPMERMRKMISLAKAPLALSCNYKEDLPVETIRLEGYDFRKESQSVENINENDDMCYAIFTSGSTGEPKGLGIRHRNFANFACDDAHNECTKMIREECNTVLASTNFVFDVSMSELLLPLAYGKTILLANDIESVSQSDIDRLMREYRFDVIEATPTKMKGLMEDRNKLGYLKQLKMINLAGEAFPRSLYNELRQYTKAQIFNLYGPAETTVWSTGKHLANDDITIGKPVANNRVYILGKDGTPMPMGVEGELCIGGDSVGMGYLGQEDLTAGKFVDDPYAPGSKMYKTGDLAMWNEDGELVYLGRSDTQVKINGQRIETGEIESLMCEEQDIGMAAVVKVVDGEQEALAAYYTSPEEIDETKLKATLKSKLAPYMVPRVFRRMAEGMPLTKSNKIDRNRLPKVEIPREIREIIPPATDMEKLLCSVMEEATGMPFGRNTVFMDVAGSVKGMTAISMLSEKGHGLCLQDMHKPVEQLARFLGGEKMEEEIPLDLDVSSIQPILDRNRRPFLATEKKTLGNILLTGAKGFLGAHLLHTYLENEEGEAYCIVRGENADKHLHETMSFYFKEGYPKERVHVLQGDLAVDMMGLARETYEKLGKEVSTVIHSAAIVAHSGSSNEFYRNNILATENIVKFCEAYGKRLVHISTTTVSGEGFASEELAEIFDETKLYIGQELSNVYARSKFAAEKLVLQHMEKDLRACIMRMGNLTNRHDGMFQRNFRSNAFQLRLAAVLKAGVIAQEMMEVPMELTPVDDAARAVYVLACHDDDAHTVFHIANTHVVETAKLLAMAERITGKKIQVVSLDEFTCLARKESGFANNIDRHGNLVLPMKMKVRSDMTEDCLKKLGFAWKEVDEGYVRAYIENMRHNQLLNYT